MTTDDRYTASNSQHRLSDEISTNTADTIPPWMARLLRFLPDPACAHEPGSVDPPKITFVSLAAWQNGHNRFNELRHHGVPKFDAAVAVGSPTGT